MDLKDVVLTWGDINIIEHGYKVYRSDTPMDINQLPNALSFLPKNSTEFIDKDQVIGSKVYYRVSAWIDGHEAISDEIELTVSNAARGDGGEQSVITIDGVYYRVHEFNQEGTTTFTVSDSGLIDVLIVGAGGGGGGGISGNYWGSGGGGGEVVWTPSLGVAGGTYTINVGSGGISGTAAGDNGDDGEPSSAFGMTANPGLGGQGADTRGGASGSGQPGGIGTSMSSPNRGGGGGGGATQAGSNGGNRGGKGGDGLDVSMYLTTRYGDDGWFGGGGGGFNGDNYTTDGGGKGGGATPEATNDPITNSGMPNTGGGAGERRGKGGSGTVIIRYEISKSEYDNFN